MFAIGFLLFVGVLLAAVLSGICGVEVPEWVEDIGGASILLGLVLMLVSLLWAVVPGMWRALP